MGRWTLFVEHRERIKFTNDNGNGLKPLNLFEDGSAPLVQLAKLHAQLAQAL